MKELNLKKCLDDIENAELVEDIYQNTSQIENYGVKLYKVGKAVIYVEDACNQINEYLLNKIEAAAALKDPKAFLADNISEWAMNEDNSQLARYQWAGCVDDLDRYIGDDQCKILVIGCYNGYQPVNWLKDEEWNDIVFENSNKAQEWIDEAEREIYYLSHNEVGRPDYYIIEQ